MSFKVWVIRNRRNMHTKKYLVVSELQFCWCEKTFVGFWVYIVLLNKKLEINVDQKYYVLNRPEKQDLVRGKEKGFHVACEANSPTVVTFCNSWTQNLGSLKDCQ